MDFSFDNLNYNSIENVPGFEARAAFTVNSATVFKEDVDIRPTIVDETLSYIPWGGDNQLPFNIINLIDKDKTLSTCQVFNAEVCFGSGLRYGTCIDKSNILSFFTFVRFEDGEEILLDNIFAKSRLEANQIYS